MVERNKGARSIRHRLRCAGETLEVLKQGILNRKQSTGDGTLVCKEYPEETKDNGKYSGESAGDGTLEALTPGLSHYELQQMLDDMREMCADGSAGSVGTLEEQMTSPKKIMDEAMVLQEYEVCAGGKIIKVHTAEIEQDPNEVEGGKEDILISADLTAEQKSVARGFLLDPGGDNISPEITGDWTRNNNEEGQGAPT